MEVALIVKGKVETEIKKNKKQYSNEKEKIMNFRIIETEKDK